MPLVLRDIVFWLIPLKKTALHVFRNNWPMELLRKDKLIRTQQFCIKPF